MPMEETQINLSLIAVTSSYISRVRPPPQQGRKGVSGTFLSAANVDRARSLCEELVKLIERLRAVGAG